MAKRGIKFEYSVGELVLCFEPDPTKARVLYDAKVLDNQVSRDKQGRRCAAYLVHFQGWNNSWDRLVPESYVLKGNEENKILMRRLTETAKKHRKNRQRRRKIDQILRDANVKAPTHNGSESESESSGSEDETDSENDDFNQNYSENGKKNRVRRKQQPRQDSTPVIIDIPDILKSRLEDDYTSVSIRGKLCTMPAKPCVVDILEGFMKTFCVNYLCEPTERDQACKDREKARADKHILRLPAENVVSLCKELVDGLRILFDFTLPIILLYATEQEQYESVMKNAKPEEASGVHEMEKPVVAESKPRRGRPAGQKHKPEEVEEAAGVSDPTPRRLTRRSTVDSHLSDDQIPTAVPTKRQKKQDGSHSPKLSPRTLRRRGIHEDPLTLTVKVEEISDAEIEFSPPASTSTATTNNSAVGNVLPLGQTVPPVAVAESIGSGQVHKKKEDLTDSILIWQIVPSDVRRQPPVMPSQVYGIHHLLRLFVKLPELLNRMPFDNNKLQVLIKLCHHCLHYLVDHQQEFFAQ